MGGAVLDVEPVTAAAPVEHPAHPASVHDVAGVLNRHGQVMGVLQFGGEYFHCATPMSSVSSGTSSIYGHELARRQTIHDVHLPTRLLRCGCGFQMEVPD